MKIRLPLFDNAHVLILGDVMLDRYWHGATSRISPEAPVPVVHVRGLEERAGGAGNVALNITSLGGQANVLGFTGDDEAADHLQQILDKANVQCRFQRQQAMPTITKLRIISRHQQLIRLDFEDGFHKVDAGKLHQDFNTQLANSGAVILSDYGKGTLSQDLQGCIKAARAAGKPVLVDPKGTDFSRYYGASIITPNQAEFEAVVGPCADDDELVRKGEALCTELNLEALLVTRSEKGMALLQKGQPPVHLPTQAREVFDVTGAGDTVIAVLAAGLAAGLDMVNATALANLAAGIVVGKLGTASVSVPELRRAVLHQQSSGRSIVTEDELHALIQDAQAHGERVVMTNGCFDILHAGHVSYLQQAAALGDRLVIAVNDDDSVRRLKGSERPINPLAQRMRVLAAMADVDWVVPFSEDTPERLYCRVLPDVLVKGGDYKPEQVAGGKCVMDNGGEVSILGFEDGCSTTNIIEAIRKGCV